MLKKGIGMGDYDYLFVIFFSLIGAFIGNKLAGEECDFRALIIVVCIYAVIIGLVFFILGKI